VHRQGGLRREVVDPIVKGSGLKCMTQMSSEDPKWENRRGRCSLRVVTPPLWVPACFSLGRGGSFAKNRRDRDSRGKRRKGVILTVTIESKYSSAVDIVARHSQKSCKKTRRHTLQETTIKSPQKRGWKPASKKGKNTGGGLSDKRVRPVDVEVGRKNSRRQVDLIKKGFDAERNLNKGSRKEI